MINVFEKIAEVSPGKYAQIKLAYEMLRGSPFQEDVDAEIDALVKKAGWGEAIGKAGLGVAATIGAAVAYNLAGDVYNKVRFGVGKNKQFRKMLEETPELKHDFGADPKAMHRIKMTFNSLHQMNPEFAADPLIAGDFVKSRMIMEGGMGDIGTLDKLVGARKSMQDSKKIPVHQLNEMWPRPPKLTEHQEDFLLGMPADYKKQKKAAQELAPLAATETKGMTPAELKALKDTAKVEKLLTKSSPKAKLAKVAADMADGSRLQFQDTPYGARFSRG